MRADRLAQLGTRWRELTWAGAASGDGQARLLRAAARVRARRAQRTIATRGLLAALVGALGVLAVYLLTGASEHRSAGDSAVVFFVDRQPGKLHEHLRASTHTELLFPQQTALKLEPGARARVEELGQRSARLVLEAGRLHARVNKQPDTRWQVDAGPYSVMVTGTRFDVAWEPGSGALLVSVAHGSVQVVGPGLGAGHQLGAGEELRVEAPRAQLELDDAAPASSAGLEPERAPAAAASARPPGRPFVHAEQPGAGERSAVPLPRVTSSTDVPDGTSPAAAAELLRVAREAQRSGDADAARRAWAACREQHAGSDEAALAAFWLGRTSAPSAAIGWFSTYLRERPGGALALEAEGRILEARIASGDRVGAVDAARRYLAQYPGGPHAGLAAHLLKQEAKP